MSKKIELEIPAGRRHIIERPRLTKLLDETSARVIMLVAPAGYGKTTLARQWLASRPHAWYQASTASSDVAALATTLAATLEPIAPGARRQLSQCLVASQEAAIDLELLAEIQSEALTIWPPDTWLAIDDYHLLKGSEAAERYVHLMVSSSPVHLLVTSRERPAWASPRGLLYGEFYEIDRSVLAMNEDEARGVFGGTSAVRLPVLVALAEGWPAVIGLASLAKSEPLDGALPETLYDFFADELFRCANEDLRRALPKFALAPQLSLDLLCFLFGPRRGLRLLTEACRAGFVTLTSQGPELHPLLRAFLLRKLEDSPVAKEDAAKQIATFLLDAEQWDDVFVLLRRVDLPDVLLELLKAALNSMLRAGRLSTLAEWIEMAAAQGLHSAPVVQLARAEVAVREGEVGLAETLALQVAHRREPPAAERFHAFCVAGRAAHLDNREADALSHFTDAKDLSRVPGERREATWGSLLCAQAFESAMELRETLADFLEDSKGSADEVLRSANARLIVGTTVGGIPQALEPAISALPMVSEAVDPLVRTSYLNILTRSLSLLARYEEAAEIADREIKEAEASRLAFVLPHAHVAKAVAMLGLRQFGMAELSLTTADRLAQEMGDAHNLLDVQTIRAKMAIATRDFSRAVELTRMPQPQSRLTSVMLGEYTATYGLATACNENLPEAESALSEAARLSSLPEVASIVACGRAVAALKRATKRGIVARALEPVFELSVFDPLVVTCRGCPELATHVLARGQALSASDLLKRFAPHDKPGAAAQTLSPREAEVLELLALGYTNKEIARALFVAEVTAKVHVRRILRKLGARSRTEAAVIALRTKVN